MVGTGWLTLPKVVLSTIILFQSTKLLLQRQQHEHLDNFKVLSTLGTFGVPETAFPRRSSRLGNAFPDSPEPWIHPID